MDPRLAPGKDRPLARNCSTPDRPAPSLSATFVHEKRAGQGSQSCAGAGRPKSRRRKSRPAEKTPAPVPLAKSGP